METAKITFLGTANAVPTKLRNHTSIFIQLSGEGILVDCGEGTQRQFMASEISHSKITHILLTHWHGDHVLGLPGLIQTLALEGYSKTLHIHGPKGTEKFVTEMKPFLGSSAEKLQMKVHEIKSGVVLETKDFVINAAEMNHGIPCLGYSLTLKEKRRIKKSSISKYKLPNSPLLKDLQEGKDIVWQGKKISSKANTYVEESKKITVILDTAYNNNALELAKDSDILICESTFTEKEREKASEAHHLTAKDAATIAKKSKSKKLALTHISQRYEHNTKFIEQEAKSIFKNTFLPKDLDVVEI
ncbi:MAG TPA: ribonuclease Z [Candidatus Nanoarchaeia archaeon]|nr:ribonuclease Z [Candidatus Nanoarchaeia archaeon]